MPQGINACVRIDENDKKTTKWDAFSVDSITFECHMFTLTSPMSKETETKCCEVGVASSYFPQR